MLDSMGALWTDVHQWTTFISKNETKANGSTEAAEEKKEDALGDENSGANGDKMEVDA